MVELDPFGGDDSDTVFRDVITLALAGFVSCVLLLLPHINPQAQASNQREEPPGNVIVEIRWPDAMTSDVDLWVQAPGDVPVGYSNKSGALFNLLRDDLGNVLDATALNYEVAYSRGLAAGEYVANVHLYRNPSGTLPVPVTMVVSAKSPDGTSSRQLLTTKVDLGREGEEMTALRFNLDPEGGLVPGSVHSLHKPLRVGTKD
ncbi:MAG: hypothetical protein EXQ94_09525 [Alphaproteobacteria bacterium]|nr:hypothetical protein [Alphaproteobacteria bacterium]